MARRKAVIDVKVLGVASLFKKVDNLKNALRNKITKKAVTAGVQVIAKAIKANAPEDTKLLKKSIGSKVKVYRNSNMVVGLVGPRTKMGADVVTRRGQRLFRNPTRYAHLAEKKTGFMANGWTASAAAANAALVSVMQDEIAKQVQSA